MRIALVSSLTQFATANYLVRALRRAGHALLVVSDVPSKEADILAQGAPDLASLCAAQGFNPELALFIEGGSMELLPIGLERLDCPTAWYGIDTHTNYARHLRLARLFDVTFIAQKMFAGRLSADGVRAVEWLPLAFPSELFPDPGQPRPIDVAFVGSLDPAIYPDRAKLFEAARKAVPRAEIGPAPPEDMIRRYAQAKIVLNRMLNNDINMRYFEAMGAGAVLLTDPAAGNGAEELFEAGTHYLVYRSEADLLARIRSALDRPDETRAMGLAARRLVEARHTYDHRVARIAETLRGVKKQVQPEAVDYFAAFASMNLAGPALHAAAAALAGMGPATRWHPVNRFLGALITVIGCAAIALRRFGAALRKRRFT